MVKLKACNSVGFFQFFDQISYIMTSSEFFFSYFERGIITCFIVVLFRFFLQLCVPWKIDIILADRLEPVYLLICLQQKINTGHSRYVDFAYLDTTTYVEVIVHSQHFFSIFLCISTPSMSKTVNMKQQVSRGDFSCPRRIFYYICYCLCRSKNRRSHGRHIVCFGYVHIIAEVRTSSKQQ